MKRYFQILLLVVILSACTPLQTNSTVLPTQITIPFTTLSFPDPTVGSTPTPSFLEESNIVPDGSRQYWKVWMMWNTDPSYYDVVLNCLNQSGLTPLLEKFAELPYENQKLFPLLFRDVTNDGLPELLILSGRNEIVLRIYSCVDGKYQVLFSKDVGGSLAPSRGLSPDSPPILTVKDVNSDGLMEISTLSGNRFQESGKYQTIGIGHKYQLFQWDGADFRSIIFDPESLGFESSVYMYEDGEIYFKEMTGDTIDELIVYKGTYFWSEYGLTFFPWRNEWDYFHWDGINYLLYRKAFDPPTYRFQAIQDADRFFRYGEIQKAMDLYTDVINDLDLEWYSPALQPYFDLQQFLLNHLPYPPFLSAFKNPVWNTEEYFSLSAYARFRLLLISLLQGKEQQAEIIYKQIQTQYPRGKPGGVFAEMAAAFWDEYLLSKDVSLACGKAIEFTVNHQDEILEYLGSVIHAIQIHIYEPDDICNIDVIPLDYLQ